MSDIHLGSTGEEGAEALIGQLNKIGMALSAEHDRNVLLELILTELKTLTTADAGTLYLKSADEQFLEFNVVQTDSLGVKMGGTHEPIEWEPLRLYSEDGSENREMVAVLCAIEGKVVAIDDVHTTNAWDFTGTKMFDASTGYRSKSMLVIPMRNHEAEIIGVCQLINRIDPRSGEIVSFTQADRDIALSVASQAAVALTNTQLINDLKKLLRSFIQSIATAIDEKSPHTGGHIRKVAKITGLMSEAINASDEGVFKDIYYDAHELEELHIAALMHDVGKITTPEYVINKTTKLETIYDRIEIVKMRFELLKRERELAFYKEKEALGGKEDAVLEKRKAEFLRDVQMLDEEMAFLESINIGGEVMHEDDIARVHEIAKREWCAGGKKEPLLSRDELENITIAKGTLNSAEREIINDHARVSHEMLRQLPFPKKLRRVPEIAGGHHERLDGTGYPLGLSAKELSLEARILAFADIFEALTASDRPYKETMPMSMVKRIMESMAEQNALDKEVVRFFYDKELHIRFGQEEMRPEQLDFDTE